MTLQLANALPSTSKRNGATRDLTWPFPGNPAEPSTFSPAGSEIYGQGERAGTLYQVEFGCVRIHRLMADGRRQIAAFYLPGEVFGFEADRTHQFFAEAVGATGIRMTRMTPDVTTSPGFVPLALQSLAHAQRHLLVLGRQNATERVAAFLVDMADRQGDLDYIDLPMTRGDIADYLGLTIETVSRIFSKFRQRGVIGLRGSREIEILKRQTLMGMSE
jgi:CRP/FNR family transcriptional regulator, nitrogen fixation regulation protein